MWLLFSSCGVLVSYSLVVVCRLLSSCGEGSSAAISEGSPLSLQCAGPPYCDWGTHLYFPKCDSSLGMVSGGMVSPFCQWILLNSSGVLLFSCGCGLGAPLSFQWSLLLGCDGGLGRGCLSSFGTKYSSKILLWLLLSTYEGPLLS